MFPILSGDNTAIGYQALYSNRISGYNTAIGVHAMYNTIESAYLNVPPRNEGFNTAIGSGALYSNTHRCPQQRIGRFCRRQHHGELEH